MEMVGWVGVQDNPSGWKRKRGGLCGWDVNTTIRVGEEGGSWSDLTPKRVVKTFHGARGNGGVVGQRGAGGPGAQHHLAGQLLEVL